MRFPHAPAPGPQGTPFRPNYAAPLAQQPGSGFPYKKKRRISGMAWIIILIAALFVLGGVLTAVRRSVSRPPFSATTTQRSYFGVDGFSDADGRGVTFRSVEPPGSPADQAGLVGGDIITSFDGQPINDRGDMMSLLAKTPIGKTVEILYLRDGELKKTSMATFSEGMSDQLEAAFRNRPEGWGQFGFDDDDSEVVPIAGTKMHGVRLDGISGSGPAALAGIQDGDIVIEFDGTPIRTVKELVARVQRAVPYSTVKVKLLRGIEQMEIPVKIGKRG
ncbi:MAG TPA: PDZ domain-containing protein [Pyrinomonadaceae bacterium]|nr:PDZ domain-containing protein [Pyrinomonadaceae bacterium]